jgi:hypothetical protein
MPTIDNNRRKRRRQPTVTPRFGSSSIALEIGLIRMAIEASKDLDKAEPKNPQK